MELAQKSCFAPLVFVRAALPCQARPANAPGSSRVGNLRCHISTAQQVARSIRLLETVAEHAAEEFAWPAPFTLEMQSCGYPNARWDLATHKLTVCYELAVDFADLYRAYGDGSADGTRLADSSKRKAIGATAFKPS
jgi:hypothetical protein